jgi:hypothetical protein
MIAYHAVVTIIEIAILAGSTDAKYECGPAIWYCIMGCSIIHGIMFVLVTCKLTHLGYLDAVNKLNTLLNQCYLLLFVLGIWSCVCWYDTKLECVDLFKSDYNKLWIMINVEVIAFFVIFGFNLIYTTLILYCSDSLNYQMDICRGDRCRGVSPNEGLNVSHNANPNIGLNEAEEGVH